ncbi:hypothetical protein BN381_90047 [Candidatus Microthrix parvicella RN1]|uniref:Uncharacterized protein n=1 Tax=Candidatus Neomicrothrix parvicella RN1 TaxID=1229780 RepID=R4Z778_9ACTN|nr:hypothetical protein BN381_90047 [Candidatus Microthrix parvicella RN1]
MLKMGVSAGTGVRAVSVVLSGAGFVV